MAVDQHLKAIENEIDKKIDVLRKDCISKYGSSVLNYTGAFNGKK